MGIVQFFADLIDWITGRDKAAMEVAEKRYEEIKEGKVVPVPLNDLTPDHIVKDRKKARSALNFYNHLKTNTYSTGDAITVARERYGIGERKARALINYWLEKDILKAEYDRPDGSPGRPYRMITAQ